MADQPGNFYQPDGAAKPASAYWSTLPRILAAGRKEGSTPADDYTLAVNLTLGLVAIGKLMAKANDVMDAEDVQSIGSLLATTAEAIHAIHEGAALDALTAYADGLEAKAGAA